MQQRATRGGQKVRNACFRRQREDLNLADAPRLFRRFFAGGVIDGQALLDARGC